MFKKITKVEEVPLTGDFKIYVENFDFSIVDTINPGELISQYQQTIYFPFRFGGGLKNCLAVQVKHLMKLNKKNYFMLKII